MKKVVLPGTEMTVSRLCLGTANFGAPLDQATVDELTDRFVEAGGNFIDTAHVYNDWIPGEKNRSEKTLGKTMKRFPRARLIISTKGAHFRFEAPEVSRVRPEEIVRDLDESLACLDTGYIDLYFLHRDNPRVPVAEIVDCLDEQVRLKKIRYVGCSNWSLSRMKEAIDYAKATGKAPFVVNQLMWSMAKINRGGVPDDYVLMDEETLAYCGGTGVGVMCYTSLAKGYFTKRWLGADMKPSLTNVYDNPENDAIYEREIAGLHSASEVTAACLTYFEKQPVTAIPIVSCSRVGQLAECCAAFAE